MQKIALLSILKRKLNIAASFFLLALFQLEHVYMHI